MSIWCILLPAFTTQKFNLPFAQQNFTSFQEQLKCTETWTAYGLFVSIPHILAENVLPHCECDQEPHSEHIMSCAATDIEHLPQVYEELQL